MATSQVTLGFPSGASEFVETALGATVLQIKPSSGTLYLIQLDNTSNGVISYVKLWYLATGSVTLGTTAPDKVLAFPASAKNWVIFGAGWAFGTALAIACVTTGGTAGTTAPTSSATATVVYT
jgi:hypothetical protein